MKNDDLYSIDIYKTGYIDAKGRFCTGKAKNLASKPKRRTNIEYDAAKQVYNYFK